MNNFEFPLGSWVSNMGISCVVVYVSEKSKRVVLVDIDGKRHYQDTNTLLKGAVPTHISKTPYAGLLYLRCLYIRAAYLKQIKR